METQVKNFNHLWIFLLTCCYFGLNPSQVTVKSRKPDVIRVRQIAHYFIYRGGASALDVAKMTGLTDHKVVYYSVAKIRGLIEPGRCQDKKLTRDIMNLTKIMP